MGWVILIGIIVCIYFVMYLAGDKAINEQKIKYESKGLKHVSNIEDIEYFGGFEDIGYSKCYIELFDDRLKINMENKTGSNRTIHFKDVQEIKAMSTTEIKEVPSISKILLLGGLGLLGKGKEKHVAVDYAVIRGKNDNFNIVLKPKDRPSFVGLVNGTFRTFNNNTNKEMV